MKKALILVAFAAYLLFLITQLPASLVHAMTKEWLVSIDMQQREGTFWKGSSSQVRYADLDLGRVAWDAHPLMLLFGEWSNSVSLEGSLSGHADVALALGQRLSLSNGFFRFDLADLDQFKPGLAAMGVRLAGKASASLDYLLLREGRPQRAEGRLAVEGLVIPGNLELGDFSGELTTGNDGMIQIDFRSVGDGEGLDAQGVLKLTPADAIELDLLVRNPDALGRVFSGILKKLSTAEQEGYRYRWQGRMSDMSAFN